MTDYWKPYEHFVPPEKHTQSKAETFTVEGYIQPLSPLPCQAAPQVKVLQQIPRDAPLFRRYAHGQAEWDIGYLKLTMQNNR